MSANEKERLTQEEINERLEKSAAEGTFKGERQHFNRIKKIYARDGFVFVSVYPPKEGDEDFGRPLKDQMFSIRDAAARARGLNAMAHKLPKKDREVAMEIVDNTIAACREAQEQAEKIQDGKSKPIITPAEEDK